MKQRCRDSNSSDYYCYGGRGISVCDEWNDYKIFHDWAMANGYQDSLTIDRKDNNKGYSPDNCRWATNTEQARNKRNNNLITYHGETKTLTEWSLLLGMEGSILRYRLKNWDIERSFTEPVRRHK